VNFTVDLITADVEAFVVDDDIQLWMNLSSMSLYKLSNTLTLPRVKGSHPINWTLERQQAFDACKVSQFIRESQRAFFPILIVSEAFTIIRSGTKYYDEDMIEKFNVSGKGAFLCYKAIMEMDNITLIGDFTQQEASQILYHCIFGTYKEDLGVLAQITNCSTWYTREDLGRKFQGVGTSKKEVAFKPIQQILYSKLSSANQTGMLSSSYLQNSSIPVFSGQRQATFSNEFFESINWREDDRTTPSGNQNAS
jgi:hypothetical protein